jgi:Glycosyltransferase family 87
MTDQYKDLVRSMPDSRSVNIRASRSVNPFTRMVLNVMLVGLVVVTTLLWTNANISYYNTPENLMDPFTDATTYLAAGERLNAGHDLYRLQPGDRDVLAWPGLYSSPLLSPPPIAVLWRPLAAVPWGYVAWIAACWVALLGTMLYVIRRAGLWGLLLAFTLSFSIGEQLAVANFNSFMPLIYILAWRYRDRATSGGLIAVAAAVKLSPVAMGGWLLGTRRWRALVGLGVGLGAIFLIAGLGAGFGSFGEYLGTLQGNQSSPESITHLIGIPGASYAVLVGGTIAAVLVGRRWPRASYIIALLAAVLGTPALYASSLVSLLALPAPFLDGARGLQLRTARSAIAPSVAIELA